MSFLPLDGTNAMKSFPKNRPDETNQPVLNQKTSRREFLERSGKAAAVSALAGVALPYVHAGHDSTVGLALVGSGGRGSGAVADALSVQAGPVKLLAMADLFESKLKSSHRVLGERYGDRIDVTDDRQFLGFDAYKNAIDCLRPGDVVILATHAAFRALHLEYAVQKGMNVFMEKSFAPDPGGIKRILALGEAAEQKNLKISTGLMCRHSAARQELIRRIRDGQLGEVQLVRAYRMDPGGAIGPRRIAQSEVLWQIQHPYSFFWVSTGRFIDYLIHQVDECCWIKDGWPIAAHGLGGRAPGSADCSQNLDTYSIEYTFADGTKALVNGRFIPKCHDDFATFLHATKCAAQFSGNVHAPTVQIYKDQKIANSNIAWRADKERMSPYQAEWQVLLNAIRTDRKHNEVKRSACSNLAAIMGRAAVHSGKIITWDEAMASDFQFCPNLSALNENSPAPVQADMNGAYPVPVPGAWTEV